MDSSRDQHEPIAVVHADMHKADWSGRTISAMPRLVAIHDIRCMNVTLFIKGCLIEATHSAKKLMHRLHGWT
jgi:hypothetical protein